MAKAFEVLDNVATIAVVAGVGVIGYWAFKNVNNIKNWFSSLNPFAEKDETLIYGQNSNGTSVIGKTNESNTGKTLSEYDPYITDGNKILKLIAVVNGNPVYSDSYTTPNPSKNQVLGVAETTLYQTVQELQQKLLGMEGYVGNSDATQANKNNSSLRSSVTVVSQPTRDTNNMTEWDKRIANNLRTQGQSEEQIKSYLGY